MGENSKIEWTDHTFNPWIGCTKVSPACDGCYAEAMMDLRYGRVKWGGERVRTSKANWRKPVAWNKQAEADGTRPRVFCASLADVFDNQVLPEWREDLFEMIRITPNLTWLLLTKRPQNIIAMVRATGVFDEGGRRALPRNVALGATIEDQQRANINVPHLLHAKEQLHPAFVFVSCEPLLGPVNMTRMPMGGGWYDALGGWRDVRERFPGFEETVDWVIAGGETDQGQHKARPSHPQWFHSLREQCKASGKTFHFKQWGEWAPHHVVAGGDLGGDVRQGRVRIVHPTGQTDIEVSQATGGRNTIPGSRYMARVGKKRSGRLLGGVEHNGFPQVSA